MTRETTVIAVRFPEECNSKIEKRAEEQEISKSEYIRQAVNRQLGMESLPARVDRLEETVEMLVDWTGAEQAVEMGSGRSQ